MQRFSHEVQEKIKYYVYRLIDPRNGETFYVGRGSKNRVFDHANAVLFKAEDEDAEDAVDLKISRIRGILNSGLTVGHVIHRFGMDDENIAKVVEAALIDAYPGLTNRIAGAGSGEFGCRHADEIVQEYSAKPFRVSHNLVLISVNRSLEELGGDVYQAVRGVWKIDPKRVGKRYIVAHRKGIAVGVFTAERWLPATPENFPLSISEEIVGRWGFEGRYAPDDIRAQYEKHRVPDSLRKPGAANPVRFVSPEDV